MAYTIWEQDDCPEGKEKERYSRAKQILEDQQAGSGVDFEPPPRDSAIVLIRWHSGLTALKSIYQNEQQREMRKFVYAKHQGTIHQRVGSDPS